MEFTAQETRHGKKLEFDTGETVYSMPFEKAFELRAQLDRLIESSRQDILSELDSQIAVCSEEVTDEFGNKKMAVLIENIEPILEKIT